MPQALTGPEGGALPVEIIIRRYEPPLIELAGDQHPPYP